MIPFRDVNVNFTPSFIYINYFYLYVLDIGFYEIRLIGVFLYLLEFFLLFYFCRKYISNIQASLVSLFIILLAINSPTFIAKDYHTYLVIFMSFSIIFFREYLNSVSRGSRLALLSIAILFLMGSLFLKQNMGMLIYASYIMVFLIALTKENSINKKELVYFFVFSMLLFLLFNSYMGMPSIAGNDSKGSLFTVLTRILFERSLVSPLILGLVVAWALFMLSYSLKITKRIDLNITKEIQVEFLNQPIFFILKAFVLTGMGVVFIYVAYRFLSSIFFTFIFSVLFFILFKLFILKNEKDNDWYLVFPMGAIIYGCTTTAGYDFFYMSVPIAYAVSIFISYVNNTQFLSLLKKKVFYYGLIIILLFNVLSVFLGKVSKPYSWFIGTSYNVFSSKKSIDNELLKGILLDKYQYNIFEDVKYFVEKFSKSKYDVYFFNLPVFYLLENKLPPTRTLIHWFDVTTTKQIEDEFRYIDPSFYLFSAIHIPTEAVIQGHKKLKKYYEITYQEKIISNYFHKSLNGEISFLKCDYLPNDNYNTEEKIYLLVNLSKNNIKNELEKYNSDNFSNLTIVDKGPIADSGELYGYNIYGIPVIYIHGTLTSILDFSKNYGYLHDSNIQNICMFTGTPK